VNSLAAWRRHNAWDPPALLELHEKTVFVGLRRLGFPEK